MSVVSGLLLAVFGIVSLGLVRRFDLRNRFETRDVGPGKFDPGAAIVGGAFWMIVFGFASAVWSVVG